MTLTEYMKQRQEEVKRIECIRFEALNVECPRCKESLYVDNTVTLFSYPPKRSLVCLNCSYKTTAM